MHRKQLTVFLIMLIVYAAVAFITYTFFADQMTTAAGVPMPDLGVSKAVLGLANAGIVLVGYGLLGLAGYWLARKVGLPGIYREGANRRSLFLIPLGLGVACALLLILGDTLFAPVNGVGRLPHPGFPLSIFASLGAGIGEEMLFRGLVFGIWALLLTWLLRRFNGRTAALWIANLIAALAFGASHLPSFLYLTGAKSLAEMSPMLIVEVFLLNGVIGLVAGQRYVKDGLVAASGVHFWTDMVWHVLWGLFA